MEVFIKLSQFLLSLSLLIVLHELGHFIPAKLFKTRVEKFYLFFDAKFSLLKKKIGETEYGIGWLPLGGYVKIAGMIDESMDKEQMAQPAKPWEFRSKPAWQRLIIMLGGVTVNFILAFVIYIGMTYVYGDFYLRNDQLKDGVWVTNPIVEKAGIHTGDKLVSIDGKPVTRFEPSVNSDILMAKSVVVNREGVDQTVALPVNFIDQFIDSDKRRSLLTIRQPFVVGEVPSESQNNGHLMAKDVFVSIDGNDMRYIDQVKGFIETHPNASFPAVVIRDQKKIGVTITTNAEGKLGIIMGGLPENKFEETLDRLGYYKFSREEYGFFESIPVGIVKGKNQLAGYWKQLKAIFNPETGAYKGVGGFKAIFDIFPQTWSWEAFWSITALLSIMLGVMNLLPIPALDGGHVMFLLYEIISRRKPSDKFMEYAQITGFVILIALVLFANGNDIYRAIAGK